MVGKAFQSKRRRVSAGRKKGVTPARKPLSEGKEKRKRRTKKGKPFDVEANVRASLNRLMKVYVLYGFDPKQGSPYNMERTVQYHVLAIEEMGGGPENFLKFYKYKLAAFYAAVENQEIPKPSPLKGAFLETDDVAVIFGGRAHRWFRHQLPLIKQQIAWAILQNKRVIERASEELLQKASEDTFEDLTTPRIPVRPHLALSWGEIMDAEEQGLQTADAADLLISKETIEEHCRRAVRDLLQGKKYTLADEAKPYFPSTSANYNRTRSAMGTVGEILQHPTLLQGLGQGKGVTLTTSNLKMRSRTRKYHGVSEQSEDAQDNYEVQREEEKVGEQQLTAVDAGELEVEWAELMQRAKKEALENELPLAEPISLAEPLKIRTITKGPPLTNFVLKPLQQWLWNALAQHKVTRLVGETATAGVIEEVLGPLREGELFVSGDYKAATNELRSFVSNVIAEEIALVCDLPVDTAVLFRRALTEHLLVNPKDESDWRMQQNGQLMGSIVSFPVLCIANVALCRWALEIGRGRRLRLQDLPLLVNGDDCVFRTNEMGKQAWRRICAAFGLKESVGKTYFSKRFLNINSTLFNVKEGDPRRLYLEQVVYPNLGIAYGMKRSGNKNDELAGHETIGASVRWMVANAPPEMRDQLIMLFIDQNWKTLTQFNIPWFLPEHFGGLGIPRPNNKFGQRSLKSDLRAAAAFKALKPTLPTFRSGMGWKVWDLVKREVKNIRPAPNLAGEVGNLSLDALCGMLCRDLILRKHKGLYRKKTEGRMEKDATAFNTYLRALEETWRKVRKSMGGVQPFSTEPSVDEVSHPEQYALVRITTSVPLNPLTYTEGKVL